MSAISREHLCVYRLWKSLLLPERKGTDIHDTVCHCIAITATNIHSAYIALYNRMRIFSRQMFEDYLYKSGNAGRFRGMRRGLYVIPREYFELMFSGTHRQREYNIKENLKLYTISDSEYTHLARHILKELTAGEKSRAQIKKSLPSQDIRTIEMQYGKHSITSTNFDQVFNILLDRWQAIPGAATWNTKNNRYCIFDRLHARPSFSMTYDDAESELVLHYIKRYGPVRVEDIAWWCDLTTHRVQSILASLTDDIKEIEISKNLYYIWRKDLNHFISYNKLHLETCHLLGQDDPLLTGYRTIEELIAPKHHNTIFPRLGESNPAVVINGKVMGTWNFKKVKSSLNLTVTMFQKLSSKTEDKLCNEIEHIGDFLGGEESISTVEIIYT